MRIHLAGVFVDDQQKALRFYTETLGFQLKHNIPLGDHAWITVVSEEAPEGTELVLEPDDHPAVRPFKRALVEDGIPSTFLRRRRRRSRTRASHGKRCAIRTVANRPRACHYRGIRRYVRQLDPDRRRETSSVTILSIAPAPRVMAGRRSRPNCRERTWWFAFLW